MMIGGKPFTDLCLAKAPGQRVSRTGTGGGGARFVEAQIKCLLHAKCWAGILTAALL